MGAKMLQNFIGELYSKPVLPRPLETTQLFFVAKKEAFNQRSQSA